MCTVTFIPGKQSIYFTSNRDEDISRIAASVPAVREFSSGRVIYPKDGKAGGTWIAGHENGNVVLFLNGAHKRHQSRPPYRKSRGLILLDLIDHITPLNCFLAVNLNNIEPFTAIIRDNRHLFLCRWDGKKKKYEHVDPEIPHIWASVTLYDEQMIEKRKKWLEDFMDKDPFPVQDDILQFHQFAADGDIANNPVINRERKTFTCSITSIGITKDVLKMIYIDLPDNKRFTEQVRFDSSMAGK